MTTPRPHHVGATTNPAAEPVDPDVDLTTLDVIGLKELQHRIEAELALIERAEPPGATRGELAEHGSAPADPAWSSRLRRLLVAIDDQLAGRQDTAGGPTGE